MGREANARKMAAQLGVPTSVLSTCKLILRRNGLVEIEGNRKILEAIVEASIQKWDAAKKERESHLILTPAEAMGKVAR